MFQFHNMRNNFIRYLNKLFLNDNQQIQIKRKTFKCYLLNTKKILALYILLFLYFFIMDIILLNKIKSQKISKTFDFTFPFIKSNNNNNNNNNSQNFYNKINIKNDNQYVTIEKKFFFLNSNNNKVKIFSNLSIKKLMITEATHFIRSPLAEFIEFKFNFSESFPYITANVISLFHCFLSIISIRFLINDSLFWRQIGVVIFQFRNFLDSFDGTIFRAQSHKPIYKSIYGSFG